MTGPTSFAIGFHDEQRDSPLDELEYGQLLNLGVNYVTTPITNKRFHQRIVRLIEDHLSLLAAEPSSSSIPDPILPPLTLNDTNLFPSPYVTTYIAATSPWIDLQSSNPFIARVSREVLNMELSYAQFCGVRSIIVQGPHRDALGSHGLDKYARAIKEALLLVGRIPITLHIPLYREKSHEEYARGNLSGLLATIEGPSGDNSQSSSTPSTAITTTTTTPNPEEIDWIEEAAIGGGEEFSDLDSDFDAGEAEDTKSAASDLFSTWKSWDYIRTVCNYAPRLFVALQITTHMPSRDLLSRWFSETVDFVSVHPSIFRTTTTHRFLKLSPAHQDFILELLRHKTPPYIMLCGLAFTPTLAITSDPASPSPIEPPSLTDEHFPQLPSAAHKSSNANKNQEERSEKLPSHPSQYTISAFVNYFIWLFRQKRAPTVFEVSPMREFQDHLQSPLQPLSDNLESAHYEVFENDPVKYIQYEKALEAALLDWRRLDKPTSSLTDGIRNSKEVIVAVAGSGRGPLVTRVLNASKKTGVPVRVWAVEKNPNAYIYLSRQNAVLWNQAVTIVKTDMRTWPGPILGHRKQEGSEEVVPIYGKVDILVSELLGSFGDNELSPECLDGIQHVIAQPHGISIPQSYTAFITPLSAPRIYQDILHRKAPVLPHAFSTPWVALLHAIDYLSPTVVPPFPRFQSVWSFHHPISRTTILQSQAKRSGGVIGGGGGSMLGAAGVNDHNQRYARKTFVSIRGGVMHGLGGYFESLLYQTQEETPNKNKNKQQDPQSPHHEGELVPASHGEKRTVEISTHPDTIDRKSRDMTSWFPIFFPLPTPLTIPESSEIEVTMWRQTDDTRVWYEWTVDVFVRLETRVKVGTSGLCSSRETACLM